MDLINLLFFYYTFLINVCFSFRYLHPPLPEARTKIYDLMFDWQAIVTSLTRIQSTGYQVALDRPTPQTYRNLLTNMPDGPEVLAAASAACTAIEGRMKEVKVYVDDS